MNVPKPYLVTVTLPDGFFARVGACNSINEAKKLIENDKRDCQETFGGLFEAAKLENRKYQVFMASWSEVSNKLK